MGIQYQIKTCTFHKFTKSISKCHKTQWRFQLYKSEISNPALIDLIRRKVKLNQPYVGIFLRKKEDDKSDVVSNLDDVHQVGVFAQIHEMQDMDYKLRLVVMAHRRIKITGQFVEDEIETGPAETLDEAIESSKWNEEHYPHLCAPFSPCVILQWTYRDGDNVHTAVSVAKECGILQGGERVVTLTAEGDTVYSTFIVRTAHICSSHKCLPYRESNPGPSV